MRRSLIYFLLLIVAFLAGCQSSNQDIVLAKVENQVITQSDFKTRLHRILMHTTQDNREIHDALLANMINEKVLIHRAIEKGWDTTSVYRFEKEKVARDIVLQNYRDRLAESLVTVKDTELVDAFVLSKEQVRARMLFSQDRDKADLLYRQLQNGASFESLAKEVFDDSRLSETGGDMGYFSWEDVDLRFAQAAQALEIGEISRPIQTAKGWYIVQVQDRFKPPYSENDFLKEKKKIRWTVTHRKKADAIRELTREKNKDLNIEFNESLLDALTRQVPLNDAFNETVPALPDSNAILAVVNGEEWRVADFYNHARFTSYRQRNSVKNAESLKQFIQGLALQELLLDEAKQKKIHTEPGVKKSIETRMELYLIQQMNHAIIDTVALAESDLRSYYEANKKQFVHPGQVNVREIVVDNEATARELKQEIENGADFAKLAARHSLRSWTAKRGGEFGYHTKDRYGDYGDLIFSLKSGDVAGPLKNGNHYSVVQVIGIRAPVQKTYDESRQNVFSILKEEKQRTVLLHEIEKMKTGLRIETDVQGIKS